VKELVGVYATHAMFLAGWTATLLLVVGVSLMSSRPAAPTAAIGARYESRNTDGAAIAALVAFLCVYAFLVMYREDLVGPDYSQFTAQRFFGMPIWPNNRRFFPFGLQEYNFLSLIKRSATLYHAFSVVQLIVLVACLFRVLDEMPRWYRCVSTCLLLLVPSVVFSIFGLIYPERDVLLLLAVWLVALRSHDRSGGRTALATALIAAQCMLYYKETNFLLVGAFAGMRLVFDARTGWTEIKRGGAAHYVRAHVLEIAHLVLCGAFAAIYLVTMRGGGPSYAMNIGRPGASLAALQTYAYSDPLLVVLAIVVALRIGLLLARKRAAHPLWDSLAIGALLMVAGYVKLAMVKDYYTAPADFIALIYLARLAYLELRTTVSRIAAAALTAGVFYPYLGDSAYAVLSRKTYVDANIRMVDALQAYATSTRADTVKLFFPQVGGFQLMEFSAYLRYRGFRMLGDRNAPSSGVTAIVSGPHRFPGDRCQPYQYFRCLYAPAPEPGSLVVLMPGRQASAAYVAELRGRGEPLFHGRAGSSAVERSLAALASWRRTTDEPTESYVFRF
jgi:hypothetical protein